MKAILKDWFENKLCKEYGTVGVEIYCELKETEKAVYAMCRIGYNGDKPVRKCMWIPKSCIENIENILVVEDYDKACYGFDFAMAI